MVDLPGAPQRILRFGHLGLSRSSADYPPARVMSAILGGMFTSRLNMNLREQATDSPMAPTRVSTFGGAPPSPHRRRRADTATATTAAALREIQAEIFGMQSRPVAEEELTSARLLLARSLPAAFETGAQAVRSLSELYLCDSAARRLRFAARRLRAGDGGKMWRGPLPATPDPAFQR